MTDKDWDDIPYVDGDCVRDEDEWNDMIAYIKHSASVDFIIYDDETSSNQAFKFSIDGTNDVIEGRTAGNDLKLLAVEGLHGYFKTGEEFKLFDGATEAIKISYAANVTTFEGGAVNGDDLEIYANSNNVVPYVTLSGNSFIVLAHAGGANTYIRDGVNNAGKFGYSAPDFTIESIQANGNIILSPNGSGLVQFGTYAAITTETLAGFITIDDIGGTPRKVAIVA